MTATTAATQAAYETMRAAARRRYPARLPWPEWDDLRPGERSDWESAVWAALASGHGTGEALAQAAYEAFYPASDRAGEIVPWDKLTARSREPWERAAEAAAGRLHTLAVRVRAALSDAPTASIARREALELLHAADLDGVLSDDEETYPPLDEITSLDTDVMEDL